MEEEIQGTELPMTHSFVYGEKRFPFNMHMFEIFSQYFNSNKEKINNNNEIYLLDTNDDINELPESSIDDFIKYFQKEKIILNKTNAYYLYLLSKKYEVKSLINATDKYIKANHRDFVIQFIQMNDKQKNYNSEECEEIISSNLMNYIHDDQLFSLPIHVLHRIMSKYQMKNDQKIIEQHEIIEFLLKCLDRYKKQASVLFENVDFGSLNNEIYRRLLNDYSDVFDFHFINKNQLKNLYDLSNEIIKRDEKNKIYQQINESSNKRHDDEQAKIQKKIEQLEQTFVNKIEEIKSEKDSQIQQIQQSFAKKIEEIKNENERKILLQNDEIRKLTEKVNQQEIIIEKLNSQNEEQNKSLIDMKQLIEKSVINKIDEFKREKDSQIQLEISKQKEDLNEKITIFKEDIRQLTEKVAQQTNIIDKSINQNERPSAVLKYGQIFYNNNILGGIITHFRDQITFSAGGSHDPSYPISRLNCNYHYFYNYYNNYQPRSESDSYIKFDFGPNTKIELTSYLLSPSYNPKSWRVEGLNDQSQWIRLDHRVNDPTFKNSCNPTNFYCQENRRGDKNYRFSSIRWIKEDDFYDNYRYRVNIYNFELYGKIFNTE